MRAYTGDNFAAFNSEQRICNVRCRVMLAGTWYTFTHADNVVSFNITSELSSTTSTPFEACSSAALSLSVLVSFTGVYNGHDVIDFPLFDPVVNKDLDIGTPIEIYISAESLTTGITTPYEALGKFYIEDITVNEDRITATISAADLLATIFNTSLPRQAVRRNTTFAAYLTDFCNFYNLAITWNCETDDAAMDTQLTFGFMQSTTKCTIQDLVRCNATVAFLRFVDGVEKLCIIPFTSFDNCVPTEVCDYSNSTNEAKLQFLTLSYNKNLFGTSTTPQLCWYKASIDTTSQFYSYAADNLDDFTYDVATDMSIYNVSNTPVPGPLVCTDYISTLAPYADDQSTVAGTHDIKLTQYSYTAKIIATTIPSDDNNYSAVAYGRRLSLAAQQIPIDTPEATTQTLQDYLTVDLPYVQFAGLATQYFETLKRYAAASIQTIDMQLRGNPYVELGDILFIDASSYNLPDMSAIVWSQKVSFDGGYKVDALLINKAAFSTPIVIYDVAAYQSSTDETVSSFFAVGKSGSVYGLWRVDESTADDQSTYQLLQKLPSKFSSAAITFDGIWNFSADGSQYTFTTDETPWIFYVYITTLYSLHDGIVTVVDTDVKAVAAERGYYSRDYLQNNTDQGLIVIYAKTDDTIMYKTYAYTNGIKTWLVAETIPCDVSGITNIQLHRLNDYRLGVCITATTGCRWLVTDRVYSQMAVLPETITISKGFGSSIMQQAYSELSHSTIEVQVLSSSWLTDVQPTLKRICIYNSTFDIAADSALNLAITFSSYTNIAAYYISAGKLYINLLTWPEAGSLTVHIGTDIISAVIPGYGYKCLPEYSKTIPYGAYSYCADTISIGASITSDIVVTHCNTINKPITETININSGIAADIHEIAIIHTNAAAVETIDVNTAITTTCIMQPVVRQYVTINETINITPQLVTAIAETFVGIIPT